MRQVRRLVPVILLILISCAVGLAQTPEPAGQRSAQGLRKLTGDDQKRAKELYQIIAAAQAADHWDDAIAAAHELFPLRTRVQGPEHWETVDAKWLLKTLRRVAVMPHEDRGSYRAAHTMNEQATTLGSQRKYVGARLLFETALEIRRRLLTDDHPHTANSYYNLALNLYRQGKYAEARPLFEKALEINRRLLTDDHPDTANSYNGLAYNLNAQVKYAEARPLYEKALEIRRRLLTDDHPHTATSYNDMAINLSAQGKYAEARPLLEKGWRSTAGSSPTTTPSPPIATATWR